MRVKSLQLRSQRIPFVERFAHSLKDRAASDTLIASVELEDGTRGYGEGLPRPYVTGETVESVIHHCGEVLWPRLVAATLDIADPIETLMVALPPQMGPEAGPVRAHHAARCAVEVAVIDALLRAKQQSLAECLLPQVAVVTYSAVITASTPKAAATRAQQFQRFGIQDIKIKVSNEGAEETVAAVREVVGEDPVLRIDANGAWSLEEAIRDLRALEPYGIASCEEPLPPQQWSCLAKLRQAVEIPLMADESFVTQSDLDRLLEHDAIDLLNVRLSKNGGIGPCLRTIQRVREAGLGFQIGAHVGETAILSAAGRHLAASAPDTRFVEGSYGTLLLSEDVARTSLRFGHQGRGPLLRGPGLGIHVLEDRVMRFAVANHLWERP